MDTQYWVIAHGNLVGFHSIWIMACSCNLDALSEGHARLSSDTLSTLKLQWRPPLTLVGMTGVYGVYPHCLYGALHPLSQAVKSRCKLAAGDECRGAWDGRPELTGHGDHAMAGWHAKASD